MDSVHLAQSVPVILFTESSVVAAVDLIRRNHAEDAPMVAEAGKPVGGLWLPLKVRATRTASHFPKSIMS
jgi:hypothetical protein